MASEKSNPENKHSTLPGEKSPHFRINLLDLPAFTEVILSYFHKLQNVKIIQSKFDCFNVGIFTSPTPLFVHISFHASEEEKEEISLRETTTVKVHLRDRK